MMKECLGDQSLGLVHDEGLRTGQEVGGFFGGFFGYS